MIRSSGAFVVINWPGRGPEIPNPTLPVAFGFIEATSNVGLAGVCCAKRTAPMHQRTAEAQMNQRARGLSITSLLLPIQTVRLRGRPRDPSKAVASAFLFRLELSVLR